MFAWLRRTPRKPRCPHDRLEFLDFQPYLGSDTRGKFACLDCHKILEIKLPGTFCMTDGSAIAKVVVHTLTARGYELHRGVRLNGTGLTSGFTAIRKEVA